MGYKKGDLAEEYTNQDHPGLSLDNLSENAKISSVTFGPQPGNLQLPARNARTNGGR